MSEKLSGTDLPAAYLLRRDLGPFLAGTPASVIREHPNGAVGVLVNGNAFTIARDDLVERLVADDLRKLVAEFEDYLDDRSRWSRKAFNEYHARFKTFGVGTDTSITDEILREARAMLPGGLV